MKINSEAEFHHLWALVDEAMQGMPVMTAIFHEVLICLWNGVEFNIIELNRDLAYMIMQTERQFKKLPEELEWTKELRVVLVDDPRAMPKPWKEKDILRGWKLASYDLDAPEYAWLKAVAPVEGQRVVVRDAH